LGVVHFTIESRTSTPTSAAGRPLIIWGLIVGIIAQAIREVSRVLVGQYARNLTNYENILVAAAIPVAVLYFFFLKRELK